MRAYSNQFGVLLLQLFRPLHCYHYMAAGSADSYYCSMVPNHAHMVTETVYIHIK